MRRVTAIILCATLVSGCTTSDVLTVDSSATPPESIGTQGATLQPAEPIAAAPQASVSRQALAPPQSAPATYGTAPTYSAPTPSAATAPATTVYDDTPGTGRAPSTFGAQAASMPAQSRPVAVQQPPAAAVAAPPAAVAAPAAVAPAATTTAPASAPATQTTAQSLASADTIRFLPIIGAPSDKLEALSTRLGDTARAAGLTIMPMDNDSAEISLKGYFSAVNQDGVVSVVYVWDVLGTDGTRLHRIQGNEAAASGGFTGADPWAGVTDEMMASIGQKTVGELLAWLDSQG
ncbi:hypothetical protein [Martelella endophytica]|uniref:hypothetical protein n=1 Tax=Martelella endophytica TaxID=1486262 RepID=UPI000696B304|nr:hypothetical protein [Martelella endophytica]